MRDMKFGIYLPNFGPYGNAKTLANLAREAEEAGWDGFFLWDHIAGYPLDTVDPWVALTAVALNTQNIRIGTTVTPLPRRRPWKLAREAVSLDHLSNGRLILGVGIGLGEEEWDHLGEEVNPKVRGQMLDEALTIIDGLWRGEPFYFYEVNIIKFKMLTFYQNRNKTHVFRFGWGDFGRINGRFAVLPSGMGCSLSSMYRIAVKPWHS